MQEDELIHFLKNRMSIVLGFAEILLEELQNGDPHRRDVQEIRSAADDAIRKLSEIRPSVGET